MRKISDTLAFPQLRHFYFFLFCFFATLPFLTTVTAVGVLSFKDENYSHIAIVPTISIYMIYLARKTVFRDCSFSLRVGGPFLCLGALLYFVVRGPALASPGSDRFSAGVFAVVVIWVGTFILFYGTRAANASKFSLLFLLLMIPIPTHLLGRIILDLQYGSADVSHLFLRLAGIPVFRQDLTFSLPGINIRVSEACSGIHSSVALMMVGLLAGHFCLESTWRKIVLSLLTVPISIVKNALRITVISGLGIYVDPGFFYGKLHRYSGYPFALVALAMLGPIFIALRRSEASSATKRQDQIPY